MATIAVELVPPFLAVAELGSFSAAAKRLGVEKSSISRSIGRLEQVVGEQLFLRNTRAVTLTHAGRGMRDRLSEPYASLDAALKGVLDGASSPRARITVTAPVGFGAMAFADAIHRLGRRHPHLEVDLRFSNDHLDLVSNSIDAAIRVSPKLKDSTLKARKLARAQAGVFASTSYVETHGVPRTPEEAAQHPWIVFRQMTSLRMRGPDGVVELPMRGRIWCDDMMFALQAALRGSGLAFLSMAFAERDVREGRLVQLIPRWTLEPIYLWFITPAGSKRTQATDALRECLVEALASRPFAFTML